MLNLSYSQNFWWAIIARFLWGFLNGNVGVVKTYLSEVNCDVNFNCTIVFVIRYVMIQIKHKDFLLWGPQVE